MAEGFASGLIEEAGLLGQDPERGPYERFRDRIMFPIRDGQDRLVGFGGRILRSDDKAPKYLNSPETPLFDKGRLLFNYAAARRSLRETGTLIVVEGYMDVIALHGAGFANAVAPLGTALTADQLGLLWKATGEPILCFDGDGAGIRAASRAIDLALPLVSPMRTLRIAYLPNGQDPDDLLKRQGPGAMQDILDRSLPLSEALFRKERGGGPLDTPERQSELKHRLGAAVSKITHQDLRKSYERAINDKWWALIRTPLPKTKSERGTSSTRNTPLTESLRRSLMMHESRREQAKPKPRLTAAAGASNFPEHQEVSHYLAEIDAALIGLILDHPELLPHVAEDFGHLEPAHGQERGKLDKIFSELIHLASAGERLDGDDLKDHLKRCGVGDAVEEVCARDIVRRMRIRWVGRSLGEAEHAWRMLAERHVKVQSLRADIEEAEAAALGDGPSADVHLQRLKALMAERQILERGSFWPEESGSGSSATDRSG
jgi:DNA primase